MSTKVFFLNGDEANYGQDEWNYVQKVLFEEGILHTEGATWNDFIDLEVEENGTPDMSVDVKVGAGVVEITKSGETFKVFAFNLDLTNLVVTNNITGSNRVDAVIIRVDVDADPNALLNNIATLEVIPGTGVTALTDGAIQTAIGSDGFIRLADVTVSNGAVTIVNANIADTRTRSGFNDSILFNPTTINFKTVTVDPAGADLVEGLIWYNSTTHYLKYYDGSAVVTLIPGLYVWGDGLAASGATISVDLATNSGLNFTATKLRVGAGDGIAISAGTTSVDLATDEAGIVFDATKLALDEPLRAPAFPAKQNLVEGDILKIINDEGTYKVDKIYGMSDETANTLAFSWKSCDLSKLSENVLFLAYTDATVNGSGRVITIDPVAKTATMGAITTTPIGTNYMYVGVATIDTNKIVACFTRVSVTSYCVVGTVVGTTVTWGTPVAMLAHGSPRIVSTNTNEAIVGLADAGNVIYLLSISVTGTTPTLSPNNTVSGALTGYYDKAWSLQYLKETDKAVLAYHNNRRTCARVIMHNMAGPVIGAENILADLQGIYSPVCSYVLDSGNLVIAAQFYDNGALTVTGVTILGCSRSGDTVSLNNEEFYSGVNRPTNMFMGGHNDRWYLKIWYYTGALGDRSYYVFGSVGQNGFARIKGSYESVFEPWTNNTHSTSQRMYEFAPDKFFTVNQGDHHTSAAYGNLVYTVGTPDWYGFFGCSAEIVTAGNDARVRTPGRITTIAGTVLPGQDVGIQYDGSLGDPYVYIGTTIPIIGSGSTWWIGTFHLPVIGKATDTNKMLIQQPDLVKPIVTDYAVPQSEILQWWN